MKTIPLTQGKVALVDDCDFVRFGHLKWCAHFNKRSGMFYAERNSPVDENGKQHTIALHREILGITDPRIKGDHKNHDTLDCRRENLRCATHTQNCTHKKGLSKHNTSGFRGVNFDKSENKWRARIKVNGKRICLGRFTDKSDAVSAYAKANRNHFGEFGGHL